MSNFNSTDTLHIRQDLQLHGNVGIGTFTPAALLDVNNFAQVYTTSLAQPSAPSLAVVGSSGSTTYYYAIVQVLGIQYSQVSNTVSVVGPDTLDGENYITITMPNSNNYIVYRMNTSNPSLPVGELGTTTVAINDSASSTPTGLLPFGNERSTGVIIKTNGTRSIYNPISGAGLIFGAYCDGFDSELRIVGNTGGWIDDKPTTYFQMQNQYNNMVTFMGGTAGHDVLFDRLQFCSSGSTFTNAGFTVTPVPTSVLEVVNTEVDTRGLFVSAPLGQTANVIEVDLDGQAVFYVDENGNTSTLNLAAGALTATTISGGYQNWESGDSSLNFDLSKGNVQTLTLTTANTSPTFSNIVGGQWLTLVITQDGTGGRTITWPDTVNNHGNLGMNLAPAAVTTFNFACTDGSTLTPIAQFGVTNYLNSVTFSSTPTFNCNLGTIQTITLSGSVSSSTIVNIPIGHPITFVIIQNGSGSNTFTWPTNMYGIMTIGSSAGSTSIQSFVSTDGSTLHAISLGVIS